MQDEHAEASRAAAVAPRREAVRGRPHRSPELRLRGEHRGQQDDVGRLAGRAHQRLVPGRDRAAQEGRRVQVPRLGRRNAAGDAQQAEGAVGPGVAAQLTVGAVAGLGDRQVRPIAVVLGRTPSRNANVCCCSHACRPITKEEKEVENNKKSSPTKTSQVHFVGDNKLCDNVTNRLYSVRHHLERTTGPGKMGFGFFPKWRKREQSLPPFLLLLLLAMLYAQTSRRAPYCHHQRVKN